MRMTSGTAATTPILPFTDLFSSHNQIHALYLDYKNQINAFTYEIWPER